MKIIENTLATLLLIFSANVSAEKPLDLFSTKNNYTEKSVVTWVPVNNVKHACEAESKRLGFNGFGFNMEACAFWDSDKKTGIPTCYIITAKKVDYWQLGHELRHCFQGPWHKLEVSTSKKSN
jgi:hypothetical protein